MPELVVGMFRNRLDLLVQCSPEWFPNGAEDFAGLPVVLSEIALVPEVRGVILTTSFPAERGDRTFVSRAFYPNLNVPEDHVTGSAHVFLGPFWSDILSIPPSQVLTASQLSPRGGSLSLWLSPDSSRVFLQGPAIAVSRITFLQ